MNKICIIAVLSFLLSFSVFSQGLYFDIGLGVGDITTQFDGTEFDTTGVDETSVELSTKLGFGPIAGSPLYLAAALEGMGHQVSDDFGDTIQFNSYILGASAIYYPIRFLQISATAGYSFTANTNSFGLEMYDSESGYGFNASAALDLGNQKHGVLIGAKYMYTNNTLEVSEVEQEMSMISIFLKYAFRHRYTR